MSGSVNETIADALAEHIQALTGVSDLADLQVAAVMLATPTVPSVDIYPADSSQDDAAFGPRSRQTIWTVRARVATSDSEGQQRILLKLMSPSGDTSLARALLDYPTLDGVADAVVVDGPTGYRLYQTLGVSPSETHVGCEWRVIVFTSTGATS